MLCLQNDGAKITQVTCTSEFSIFLLYDHEVNVTAINIINDTGVAVFALIDFINKDNQMKIIFPWERAFKFKCLMLFKLQKWLE